MSRPEKVEPPKLFDSSNVTTSSAVGLLRKETRRMVDLLAAVEHGEQLEGQLATLQASIDVAQRGADERLRATEAAITRAQQAQADAEGAFNEAKAQRMAELERLDAEISTKVSRAAVLERQIADGDAAVETMKKRLGL